MTIQENGAAVAVTSVLDFIDGFNTTVDVVEVEESGKVTIQVNTPNLPDIAPVDNVTLENTGIVLQVKGNSLTNAHIAAGAAIALAKLELDPLARANHTGVQLAATISNFDTAVRTSRLDQMAVPTADLDLNTRKITNLTDGVADTDAATVGQLNDAVFGTGSISVEENGVLVDTEPTIDFINGSGTTVDVVAGTGKLTVQVNATGAGTGDVLLGGNSPGGTMVLGTNNAQPLALETNGVTRATLNTSGTLSFTTGSPTVKKIESLDGDNLQGYFTVVPLVVDIRHGSAGTPVSATGPTVQICRYETYAAAIDGNGTNNERNAPLVVKHRCAAGSRHQINSILGFSRGAPINEPGDWADVVGATFIGYADSTNGASSAVGTGLYLEGRAFGPNVRCLGTEIRITNFRGANGSNGEPGKIDSWNSAGFSTSQVMWLTAYGGAGYRNSNFIGFAGKAHVGLGFTTGSIENADGTGTGCRVVDNNSNAEVGWYGRNRAGRIWEWYSESGGIRIGGALQHAGGTLGVFNTTAIAKQTVTGARGSNAALTSLLTALAAYGLITNSTTT
jgi:hypothetical protein